MERQPVSRLAEIQQGDAVLAVLIDKRQSMLKSAPSWNIIREDPDLEAAARYHAKMLVEMTIPNGIVILRQRRTQLQAQRATYIQEHTPALIVQAQAFETELMREQRVVERLSRDLQRGITTQDVIDRRTAQLQEMKARKHTDPDLQAGFELLSQQRQTVAETVIKPLHDSIPPLLTRLQPITFSVKKEVGVPGNMVYAKTREANLTEPHNRTPEQIQLLDDTRFIDQFADSTAYQRVYTPQDLHTLVVRIQEYVGAVQCPLDFQRLILQIVEKSTQGRRSVPPQGLSLNELKPFAVLASRAIRFSSNISDSGYLIRVKDQESDDRQAKKELYQAAFDIIGRDIYRNRNKTPQQVNLEIFGVNRVAVNAWHEEVMPLLDRLIAEGRTARFFAEIGELINIMNGRSIGEKSDKYEVGKAISLQLKIGHLVDDLNDVLMQINRRRLEQESAVDAAQPVVSSDAIPSLLPQLDQITSMHEHKYSLDNTVGRQAQEAQVVVPEQRTPKQQQLLEDIAILSQYAASEAYKDVYSPAELRELVAKLQLFSQKNRPDFNDVEDKILGLLAEAARVEHQDRSDRLVGATVRADKNSRNRRGMKWDTLNDFAGEGSMFIRQRIASAEMLSYLINISDPQPQTYPELTSVYQVVADMHALDVIGQRSIRVDQARQETFVANCQVVNDWYAEFSQIMTSLPNDPQITLFCSQLRGMIETMNNRLQGREQTGLNKDYRLSPAGAISLQKKIGHTVEQLKARINALARPAVDEGKIIPLE